MMDENCFKQRKVSNNKTTFYLNEPYVDVEKIVFYYRLSVTIFLFYVENCVVQIKFESNLFETD